MAIPAGSVLVALTEFVLVVLDGIPSGVFSVLDDAITVDAARKFVANPTGFLLVIHWAPAGTLSVLDDAIVVDLARGSCRQEIGSPLAPAVSPPPLLKIEILVEAVPSSLPSDPRYSLFS